MYVGNGGWYCAGCDCAPFHGSAQNMTQAMTAMTNNKRIIMIAPALSPESALLLPLLPLLPPLANAPVLLLSDIPVVLLAMALLSAVAAVEEAPVLLHMYARMGQTIRVSLPHVYLYCSKYCFIAQRLPNALNTASPHPGSLQQSAAHSSYDAVMVVLYVGELTSKSKIRSYVH